MRSVLLLRGLGQQLSDIEKFLTSRGFKITVVHKIHDATYFITENRPDFAFFSTELIPAESSWLFGVLNQLTSVALFVERITAKSLSVCRELKGNYVLEPPLTPLGFDQMIRRIDRDQRVHPKDTPDLDRTHVLIMSALSDLALKALCTPPQPGDVTQRVEKISKVTCFRIQTHRLSGFFLLAYGDNRLLDPSWLNSMHKELRNHLANFDEMASVEAGEEIQITEIKFPEWSIQQAEFVQYASHKNAELVLAFFKDPVPVSAKPSLRADCVEVALEHFRSDEVVNFDVYVYLPQNARFVLYTPQGGTLHEAKKQKLLTDGIRTVHIHKRSFDEVRRQKTREYISENSAEFR